MTYDEQHAIDGLQRFIEYVSCGKCYQSSSLLSVLEEAEEALCSAVDERDALRKQVAELEEETERRVR